MREIPPMANRIQSRHSALALSSPGPLAQPRRPEGACMTEFLDRSGLSVDSRLADFIEQRALPGTGLDVTKFWADFVGLLAKFAPENAALLAKREDLQTKIDAWHKAREGQAHDARSEEHTSELQSLMRISYAVFCLKKKHINKN